ncbi:MAG: hypothetical protein HDR01_01480 [Lachnospiraceae bacterium]|nr:hypothetical protein [Lachnospiraceae bacterium]
MTDSSRNVSKYVCNSTGNVAQCINIKETVTDYEIALNGGQLLTAIMTTDCITCVQGD